MVWDSTWLIFLLAGWWGYLRRDGRSRRRGRRADSRHDQGAGKEKDEEEENEIHERVPGIEGLKILRIFWIKIYAALRLFEIMTCLSEFGGGRDKQEEKEEKEYEGIFFKLACVKCV